MRSKTPKPRPWKRVEDALRPLNTDERAELERSIAEHGIVEAVKVLPDGRIIDGHHRWMIGGRKCPVRVLQVSADQGFRIALQLNTARRQLTAAERREAIARTLEHEPERSNVDIAREHGVTDMTVGRVRSSTSTNVEMDTPPKRPRSPRKTTPEEIAQAWMLHDEGVPQAKIAEQLGRPQSSVSNWLRRPRPVGDDELVLARQQRRMRNEAAWRKLADLNHRAVGLWKEDRAALAHSIEQHPEHNLVVALATATRRTRDIADAVLAMCDTQLSDDERARMDALMRASGFGEA